MSAPETVMVSGPDEIVPSPTHGNIPSRMDRISRNRQRSQKLKGVSSKLMQFAGMTPEELEEAGDALRAKIKKMEKEGHISGSAAKMFSDMMGTSKSEYEGWKGGLTRIPVVGLIFKVGFSILSAVTLGKIGGKSSY